MLLVSEFDLATGHRIGFALLGLRAKLAFWLPPVPNRPHLAGCTADLPVFRPPCAAPNLRAVNNTAHVATHLEKWDRRSLALPALQDCIAVHVA
jgi:hypothetical protein